MDNDKLAEAIATAERSLEAARYEMQQVARLAQVGRFQEARTRLGRSGHHQAAAGIASGEVDARLLLAGDAHGPGPLPLAVVRP